MATETGEGETDSLRLSPDEAFSVLGNETRLEILRTLGASAGPLTYAKLYERVEYDDPSNFSYHLNKLVGHFVRKTDDGYYLYDAGRRVVEAVVSGAVSDSTVVEPTETEKDCPFCGAPVAIGLETGHMAVHVVSITVRTKRWNAKARKGRNRRGYPLAPRVDSERARPLWTSPVPASTAGTRRAVGFP